MSVLCSCVGGCLCVSRLHRENESLREELSSTRELVQRLEEDRQRDQATMQDLRTHTQTLQRGYVDKQSNPLMIDLSFESLYRRWGGLVG